MFLQLRESIIHNFINLKISKEIQIEKKEELNFQKSFGVDMEGIDPGILIVICWCSFLFSLIFLAGDAPIV